MAKRALFDFRLQITAEIDTVLSARAKVMNLDKAAIAREVLEKWAATEMRFRALLETEGKKIAERETVHKITRQPLSLRTRNAVFARDGRKCRECSTEAPMSQLHIDHIIPVSAGGGNELANLRILCRPCNLQKADKIVCLPVREAT